MIVYDYPGRALTHQKITPGNTATGLSAYCYKYRVYRLNFDAGTASNALAVGYWVYGVNSGAVGHILYLSAITGSWAGNDAAGYVLIDSWNGTAWTNNEKLGMGADTTMADVDQAAAIVEATDGEYILAGMLEYKGMTARRAQVIAYANTLLCGLSGDIPDQTALIGLPLTAGSGLSLPDADAMAGFKCIDYTASSAGIAQVRYFF